MIVPNIWRKKCSKPPTRSGVPQTCNLCRAATGDPSQISTEQPRRVRGGTLRAFLAKATEGVAGVTCGTEARGQTWAEPAGFCFKEATESTDPKVSESSKLRSLKYIQNGSKIIKMEHMLYQLVLQALYLYARSLQELGVGWLRENPNLKARVTTAKWSWKILEASSQTRHRSHGLRTKSLAARLSAQPLPLLVCLVVYGNRRGFKKGGLPWTLTLSKSTSGTAALLDQYYQTTPDRSNAPITNGKTWWMCNATFDNHWQEELLAAADFASFRIFWEKMLTNIANQKGKPP